jgi:iron complex transport system permease protein
MKDQRLAVLIAVIILITCIGAALTLGRYRIGVATLGEIISLSLRGNDPSQALATPTLVLWSVRLPRVVIAIIVGAALAVAGAVFQSLFRNPLVSPGILGVTSGASFGAPATPR